MKKKNINYYLLLKIYYINNKVKLDQKTSEQILIKIKK